MQQWLPRHKLKDRPYVIEKELGQGGFGITYKAEDLSLGIPVVIKTPNSRLQRESNYKKYVENFEREARRLAKLGLNPHSHIVRVSSFFYEDNLPCIVMDFIPGDSLYDLVRTQGKLSEERAIKYIKQIGSALVICHKAGIIHRDAHPGNILIHADSGKAILIDFGISGNIQTSRNTYSGNQAFAPWEQIAYWERRNNKTPQIDIYTLGASLYYLVMGEIPTDCCSRKYNNSELIEPKQLNPNLSDAINRAILRGMEVEPQNRPTSMQKWLQLLPSVPDAKYSERKSIPQTLKMIETSYRSQEASVPRPPKQVKPSHRSEKYRVILLKVLRILSYTPLAIIFFFVSVAIIHTIVGREPEKNPDGQIEKPENLPSQSEPTSTQYSTHSVIPVAFSPDNQIIASGSLDNKIRLHNLENKKIATLRGHSDKIFSVAFSPNGKILASGGADNTVRLWNVETEQEIATLVGHQERIISVAFSPDGKILASGSADNTVRLWNIETEQEIATLTGHLNIVTSVAFSSDGKILASGSADNTVKLYDVATKQENATFIGHSDGINSIAFSSNGRVLASGSNDTIKLWDVKTREEITEKGIPSVPSVGYEAPKFSGAESLIFSPHGTILASIYRGNVEIWNVANGRKLYSFLGHANISEIPSSIAFSSDGNLLAIGNESYVNDDRKFNLHNLETKVGRSLTGHSSIVDSVTFSPDSKLLASGSYDNTIKLWNVETKQEIATLVGHSSSVNSVAFSPDGKLLASGSSDDTVKLWDVETEHEIASLEGHSSSVNSVAFSPDGKLLASNGSSEIKLWNVETKQEIAALENNYYNNISFSPDSTMLASGRGNTIRLWDVETKQVIATLKGHSDTVCSIAFSPDGTLLASVGGGRKDKSIKWWNVETKQVIANFTSSNLNPYCRIAFSPDGKFFANSSDRTIRLWNTKTKQRIDLIDGSNEDSHNGVITSIAFSPDDKTLASGSQDATIILWDVETKTENIDFK